MGSEVVDRRAQRGGGQQRFEAGRVTKRAWPPRGRKQGEISYGIDQRQRSAAMRMDDMFMHWVRVRNSCAFFCCVVLTRHVRRGGVRFVVVVVMVMGVRHRRAQRAMVVAAKVGRMLNAMGVVQIVSVNSGNRNLAVPKQAQRKQHRQGASHQAHVFTKQLRPNTPNDIEIQ